MAGEFVARPYQEYAIRQIIEKPALALMLDMGLGKTVTTLTAMQLLKYDYFDVSKVLVIAPLRVAESTWTAECECWEHLKGFHGSRILGSAGERLKALKRKQTSTSSIGRMFRGWWSCMAVNGPLTWW